MGDIVDRAMWARATSRESVESRVSRALACMVENGEKVSFYAVAARANVSRSTLYRNELLRGLVIQARNDCVEAGCEKSADDQLRDRIALLEASLADARSQCAQLRELLAGSPRSSCSHYYVFDLNAVA